METGPIADFYDRYVPRQLAAGVNARHELIHDLAVDNGLRDGMRVLEIGCGVGTLTSLLARRLANGSLLAVDLSPGSIEQATTRLRRYPHVRFAVADAVTAELPGPFDMIILPDVLEHVPADQHVRLFGRLKALRPTHGTVIGSVRTDPNACRWWTWRCTCRRSWPTCKRPVWPCRVSSAIAYGRRSRTTWPWSCTIRPPANSAKRILRDQELSPGCAVP